MKKKSVVYLGIHPCSWFVCCSFVSLLYVIVLSEYHNLNCILQLMDICTVSRFLLSLNSAAVNILCMGLLVHMYQSFSMFITRRELVES